MAGNQAVVEFLLKWSESGGQLPDKVKRDLDRMGQSSTQATTLTDKLGQAFTRLERREPTNAMRQLRGAIDGMASSALGASGPVGRLGLTFLSLGPGGIATTGAVAGLGLIGLAYKQSAKEANQYIDATEKAIDATRRLLGSRHLGAIEERANVGEQLRVAKAQLAFEQHPVIEGFAATPSAAKIQEATMLVRTLQLQFDLADAAVKRLEASMRDSLANRGVQHINTLRDAAHDSAVATRQEAERFENQMRAIQESHARVLPLAAKGRLPLTLRGKVEFAQRTDRVTAQEPEAPEPTDTGAIFSALLGLVGSVQGGAGGALSGLGGLASVALRSTPILGQVLSFGGGLLSLFSSGQAKVSISRLEQEALEQMRQVQQVPQYLSQNIVTNDLRGAKNRLARLEQLDTVTRGVT